MQEPWNDASVLPPPAHTCHVSYTGYSKDVKHLSQICESISKTLSKQSPLHQESAILSRFLYKFDKKFRNDIGYRNLKKVNTALRKYLKLDLLKDIGSFMSMLPTDSSDQYLPTQQVLEYILVRIMSFSKIMLRICVCSKRAGVFYLDRTKRGESHWMSLMPYALTCRIWSMSSVLLKNCCNWYSYLYPYLEKFEPKGLPFLPPEYKLPIDIEQWLDLKNLDNFGRFEWSQNRRIDLNLGFIDDEESETLENVIIDYVNQINDEEVLTPEAGVSTGVLLDKMKVNILKYSEKSFDKGEAISRESIANRRVLPDEININVLNDSEKSFDKGEAICRKSIKDIKKTNSNGSNVVHSPMLVTNTKTLKKFIEHEEAFRHNEGTQSLTKHLSFMQWQALKKSLEKIGNPLSKNKKIERKFQKIWQEKCLDYIQNIEEE